MSIFSKTVITPVVEQTDDYLLDMYPEIVPTAECGYEIAQECQYETHKLASSLYIADIMIEQAAMEGATDIEAVIESTVKEHYENVKKKFTETLNKILAWFAQVIKDMKVMMSGAKAFIRKYKGAIEKKISDVGTFTVKASVTDEDVAHNVTGMMTKLLNFAKSEADKTEKSEDFVERMCKAVDSSASSVGDLKKNLRAAHFSAERVEKSLNSSDVKKMVSFCDNSSIIIGYIEDLKNFNKKEISAMINGFSTAEEMKEVNKAKEKYFGTAIGTVQQLNTLAVSMVKEIAREYLANLKALLTVKPKATQESFTPDEELMTENKTSIFESAMSLF